jgi:type I restriction-modification system DNA methylase subunit
MSQLENIEAIEKRLWSAADTLRANSNYASNEYFMPVMGLVFLRHAYSRYLAFKDNIEASMPSRGGIKRALMKEDFSKKSSIFLQSKAQFDYLVGLKDSDDRAKAIIDAMESIEADYETLRGVLPKQEYRELDNEILGQLLRTLDPDELKKVSGDVFGRIYEYFLTQFADQKAHDGGEFFTPISLVSLIANVLEPKRGTVLDPACGSGGMFVQSAHFVENQHENPNDQLAFYGLEKNGTTINLAKMNLAVHGLVGDIKKAITYYEDPHNLYKKADFVMANPPFNVDEIDAEKIKNDPRLPFGLPGVNKKGKVSNGNYVWISYFYSYLTDKGRCGFVMSSQASSAGKSETKVRQKLIETGHVDIIIAIRSNFFYTRAVPCELWFIDRAKPDQPSSPTLLPVGEGGELRHYRGGYDFSGLVQRARELRKQQTPAESLFWELVRNRQFLGLKFRRQHQTGDYILDFYCHEERIAVELDGLAHDKGKTKDAKRDAYLKSQGIKAIRITNHDLLNYPEQTLQRIFEQLPSPHGRGDRGEGIFSGALNRKGHVLMIDARNIYRKITRKIFDFSPEQLQNILSIVWLYRGETKRFRDLVVGYISKSLEESEKSIPLAGDYDTAFDKLNKQVAPFIATLSKDSKSAETIKELAACVKAYKDNCTMFFKLANEKLAWWEKQNKDDVKLFDAVKELDIFAEENNKLIKEAELMFRLINRLIDECLNTHNAKESEEWKAKEITNLKKQTEEARDTAVNQLKIVRYFHYQAEWLTERFPEETLRDVEGLVKLVDRKELEENDWSLTPGRYVGVAPEEEDPDFDFGEAMRAIHAELENLNAKAGDLTKKISENFRKLGI